MVKLCATVYLNKHIAKLYNKDQFSQNGSNGTLHFYFFFFLKANVCGYKGYYRVLENKVKLRVSE